MKRGFFLFALFFLFSAVTFSQDTRFKLKRKNSFYLPDEVRETSGLAYWNGQLITHNDSGGKPELYVTDTLGGEVKKVLTLTGAKNHDWESMYIYNNAVYVGDFGNNNGSRKNLIIYKSNGTDFVENGESKPDSILFYYPDQEDFTKRKHEHNFDCEAMVVFRDSIYLYSKSWSNKITTIRAVPSKPGTYSAPVINQFDALGLITDAVFDEEKKILVLVGYNLDTPVLKPFLWIYNTPHPARLNDANGLHVRLSPDFTQIEGVTFLPSGRLAISAEALYERFIDIPAALYLVWPQEFFERAKP